MRLVKISKMMPDQSAVHVLGNGLVARKKRRRNPFKKAERQVR